MKEKFGRILRKTLENMDGESWGGINNVRAQMENVNIRRKERRRERNINYPPKGVKRKDPVLITVNEVNAIAMGFFHS